MAKSTYQSRTLARAKRRQLTSAEVRLWSRLNRRQLGIRFRPQVAKGNDVVDFYCHGLSLAIEIDDTTHDADVDAANRAELVRRLKDKCGVRRVLWFSNDDVFYDIEGVLTEIRAAMDQLAAGHPPPG